MERSVPDGPADLRRRRLRQDRDRGAGGVQGGPGRQAGRGPGADDAAGPAAPADLHRALRPVPGRGQGPVPVPDRRRGQGGRRRAARRLGRRGHRHPPAALGRDRGSRTSAWSSSTRSSASASSTRSSSSGCAPRSTCWPCPRRRSRAPWRWPSPASARCRRSPPRRRSGTPCSPSSVRTTRSRSPRRSGASCCVRARSSTSTTGSSSIERAAARLRELVPEARVATAHGQMGEHQLEQVDRSDFWEKRVRRAGLHHDRRDRPGHLQRQHPDPRARRHARPLPAAPAARPRRPRPRARLRLLPLPAGEAAHRDRARPAGDHRASTPTSAPACRSR